MVIHTSRLRNRITSEHAEKTTSTGRATSRNVVLQILSYLIAYLI